MLLGVVSDTHGQLAYTREAVRMLAEFQPAAVIHCGDIGSVEVVRQFNRWPTHFVLGNVDDNAAELEQAIAQAGLIYHGRFGSLEMADRRIAFLHGDDVRRLRQEIASSEWDLVCSGHTHQRDQRREGKTLALNPGALYRAHPHSLAIVDLATMEVTSVTI
jgi:putative phosphoesterase